MPNVEMNPDHVLLCVDLEAGSEELIDYAIEWVARCGQVMEVLYVSHSPVQDDQRNRIEQQLRAWIGGGSETDRAVVLHIEQGAPEEVIPEIAAKRGVGLILMGRRHRSVVERIYVGSTTSAVFSHARRPVLVVPVGI